MGELTGLLEWPVDLSFSPKLQTLHSFKSHTEIWTCLLAHIFSFYCWLSELTYFRFFFLVICWSYLRREISVILSTGNKLHSRHLPLFFSLSCETTLLMLSCDHIESAKFIHGIPLPAKLVYYIITWNIWHYIIV